MPSAAPLSWRRSAEDWKLLANLHVALYPQADEAFRLGHERGRSRRRAAHHVDAGAPMPVDDGARLIWQDRSAAYARMGRLARPHARAETRRPLAGVRRPFRAKASYYGEMEVEPSGNADDEFTTA